MRRTWIAAVLVVLLIPVLLRAADAPVGPRLQATSVNIKAQGYYGNVQGSGTVFLVPRKGEKQTAWVVTAHHVVDSLRRVEDVIDDGGRERKKVRYDDAQVVRELASDDNSRMVGDTRLDAKVISVDRTRDIALLQIRTVEPFRHSAEFYLDNQVPVAGTEVYHCGAPGGQDIGGSGSLTDGIVSRTGVRIREYGGSEEGVYDQVTCDAMGGSSGGMVCLRDTGEWVGMITLGIHGGDFFWMVPVRNVRDWAEEVGVEWLLEPKGRCPTEEEIKAIPLENSGFNPEEDNKKQSTESAVVTMPKSNEFPLKPRRLPAHEEEIRIARP